jgi:predicted ABC-type transport system involved in lysophospholipase L1 biosynthesis ATPase subunit
VDDDDVILSFTHVALDRHKGRRVITVLKDVCFELASKGRLALTGPSGSGKSSILDLAAGRLVASDGAVMFDGRDLAGLDDTQRSLNRLRAVSYVHQDALLLPQYSAQDNVALRLTLQGMPRPEAMDVAATALERVGLADRASHRPSELSGGERQRVAIARAIVTSPLLLLADEPTGSLDAGLRDEMISLLFETSGSAAVLTVTHDPAVACRSERVLRLTGGELCPIARRGF